MNRGFVVSPLLIWVVIGLFTIVAVKNIYFEGGTPYEQTDLAKFNPASDTTEASPPTSNPSFQDEKETLGLIENLPEVKEFKKRIEDISIAKPVMKIDGYPDLENPYYSVHVFEEVPDTTSTFHTATFNWYRVYPKAWIVTKRDLSTEDEKWDVIDATTVNIIPTPTATPVKMFLLPKSTPTLKMSFWDIGIF